jgi:hypothetical protein
MRARHLAAAGLAALAALAPAASAGPLPPLPGIPEVVSIPALGTYHGGLFPSDVLLGLGLSCNVADRALSCYDTPIQAKAAGPVQPRAGENCHPALRIWLNADHSGKNAQLALYDRGYWLNLPGGWRNGVSAFATGCAKVTRFSDLPDGAGPKLARPARRTDLPPAWNDRIDAVFRG